jgi:CRP-like cAMP-binding protein
MATSRKFLDWFFEAKTRNTLRRMEADDNYQFIRLNYLFKQFSTDAMAFILEHLVERRYNRDDLIFKEENPSICFFIIKQGSAEIFVTPSSGEKIIYETVSAGQLFGEVSVISASSRTASARALEGDTILLVLSTFDLEELCKVFPVDGLKLLRAILGRITNYLVTTTRSLRTVQAELHVAREEAAKR